MKPETNTSPRDLHLRHGRLAREAAAVAAHELHLEVLRRERDVALDQRAAALVVALAELGRDDQLAHRLADRLARGPAEEPLGRRVPAQDHAVAVERDEGVGSRVEHEPGARPPTRSSSSARGRCSRRSSEEISRPATQRRAHREQPAHDGLSGSWIASTIAYDDRHERHLGERLDEREEVEGVERRPHVEQRVERGRARVVVREADDQRPGERAPRGCASRGRGPRSPRAPRPITIAAEASSTSARSFTSARVREHEREQPERARPPRTGRRSSAP